ncbi:uncharacterized protein AMSG_11268 [Thecamonas trahens ATCC 50062]|uniref:Uncharacterized protein n=1 Tax=Thecamonas trahens ATCC 50062 TaxID=461836 RepID=A0A0L0DWD3_THETB|nr:hypothetical protein AMSG_11268 [Thecamonas trahens ATCC 50062]KNC55828.1 hypothetical protein AMSG_11268 [Thecamonas trahens ATCC 50062]|eukprot:XP_013752805.1 hypothetical protein AMSG_11268 [Thecamonas trahens ATCC 50062]
MTQCSGKMKVMEAKWMLVVVLVYLAAVVVSPVAADALFDREYYYVTFDSIRKISPTSQGGTEMERTLGLASVPNGSGGKGLIFRPDSIGSLSNATCILYNSLALRNVELSKTSVVLEPLGASFSEVTTANLAMDPFGSTASPRVYLTATRDLFAFSVDNLAMAGREVVFSRGSAFGSAIGGGSGAIHHFTSDNYYRIDHSGQTSTETLVLTGGNPAVYGPFASATLATNIDCAVMSADGKTIYVSARGYITALQLESQTYVEVAGKPDEPPIIVDGLGSAARFARIRTMALDHDNHLIVNDECIGGSVFRRVNLATAEVTTIWGDVGDACELPRQSSTLQRQSQPWSRSAAGGYGYIPDRSSKQVESPRVALSGPARPPPTTFEGETVYAILSVARRHSDEAMYPAYVPVPPPSSPPPPPPGPPVVVQGCVNSCVYGPAGGVVTFVGTGFNATVNVTVNGVSVYPAASSRGSGSGSGSRSLLQTGATTGSSTLTFDLPAGLPGGYPTIVVTTTTNATDVSGVVFIDAAVAFNCTATGLWFTGTECRPCPTGAVCPGGSRLWPRLGYWSYSELTQPGACAIREACCGALGEMPEECPLSPTALAGGVRNTQQCDTSAGYTGEFCDSCITPAYFRDGGVCRVCDKGDKGELALLVITALIMTGLVFLGIAVLSVAKLSAVVAGLLALQQVVFVGRLASSRLNSQTGRDLNALFRSLSFVLFDVEFVQPACYFSASIGFVQVFWGTLALIGIAIVAFLVASGVYAVVGYRVPSLKSLFKKKSKGEGGDEANGESATSSRTRTSSCSSMTDDYTLTSTSWSEQQQQQAGTMTTTTSGLSGRSTSDRSGVWSGPGSDGSLSFRGHALNSDSGADEIAAYLVAHSSVRARYLQRAPLALIMLLTAVYFQLTLRCVQGVYCKQVNSQKRLAMELSTLCYEGSHKSTVVVIWILIVVYVAGFPLITLFLMTRALQRGALAALKAGPFAFLTRGLHVRYFWFRLLALGINLVLVLQTTLSDEPAVKIFAAGMSFLANTVVVIFVWPFKVEANNWVQIAVGLAAAIQLVFFLDADALAGETAEQEAYRNALAITIAAVLLLVLVWRVWRKRDSLFTGCCADHSDHEYEADSMSVDERAIAAADYRRPSTTSFGSSATTTGSTASTTGSTASSDDGWNHLRETMALRKIGDSEWEAEMEAERKRYGNAVHVVEKAAASLAGVIAGVPDGEYSYSYAPTSASSSSAASDSSPHPHTHRHRHHHHHHHHHAHAQNAISSALNAAVARNRGNESSGTSGAVSGNSG